MQLGAFSVSLTVKDLAASRTFYEQLGSQAIGGNQPKNWLVLRNDTCTIGLFHGMFDKNTLTFNPGWSSHDRHPTQFQDVREIQRELQARGITPAVAAEAAGTGPAFLMVMDPDGNPVLIDQHVNAPGK